MKMCVHYRLTIVLFLVPVLLHKQIHFSAEDGENMLFKQREGGCHFQYKIATVQLVYIDSAGSTKRFPPSR